MGYLGYERTLKLVKERFYWPQMNDEVKQIVGKICKCIKDKKPVRLPQAPQESITCSAPMKLVGRGFLHLDTCVGGFQYLLVITDHFTRYTQVYPTRKKEAKTSAEKLFNDYILRFGMPGQIVHDQGREFENKLFQQLSKSCNIKRLCLTPYHPQCNGQVERMSRSIILMLKTLESTEKKSWKNHINKLVHAYNCNKNSSTRYASCFLLLGRKPRLPIDLILSQSDDANEDHSHFKFVKDWKTQ